MCHYAMWMLSWTSSRSNFTIFSQIWLVKIMKNRLQRWVYNFQALMDLQKMIEVFVAKHAMNKNLFHISKILFHFLKNFKAKFTTKIVFSSFVEYFPSIQKWPFPSEFLLLFSCMVFSMFWHIFPIISSPFKLPKVVF